MGEKKKKNREPQMTDVNTSVCLFSWLYTTVLATTCKILL